MFSSLFIFMVLHIYIYIYIYAHKLPLSLSFFEYRQLIFFICLKFDFLCHQCSAIFPFYYKHFRLCISKDHFQCISQVLTHSIFTGLDLNIFMFLMNLFIAFTNVLGYFVYISGFEL